MNNSTKMHTFLQRMLKKSDDELEFEKKNLISEKLKVDNLSQNKTTNWIKNLGNCSPSKSELTPITRTPSRPITLLKTGEYRNDCRQNMPALSTQKSRPYSEGSSNIDQIRREFEMGFLSPTQRETTGISSRSGLFVKKIVAAFEEKYKAHNDAKVGVKECSQKCDSSDESSFEEEKTMETMMKESMTMLSDTCVIESLESRLTRYLDSYIASSSVREEEEGEEEEEAESPSENETSLDPGKRSFTIDDQQCSPILKNTPSKLNASNSGVNSSRERTNVGESTPKSSPGKLVRRDSSIRRERQPKIVGAYLKKPIEVDDTSIDWIPITGKKLPRKKSFKRLLSILTGKKSSEKSSKLYCSEINLQEDAAAREHLQDSGYDEKSGSSSSLTSLVSINDLLSQQKSQDSGIHEDDRRVYNMKTFGQVSQTGAAQIDTDQDFRDDDFSSINDEDTWSVSSKKLFLEEVSRSELRLSLGPSFPSAAGAKVICSLDRREAKWPIGKATNNNRSQLDENGPLLPSLPKSLFATLKKRLVDPNDSPIGEKTANKVNMSFSEFEKVQLRRDVQSWKFPTEEFHYDTPRRFLSKSEPGLPTLLSKQRTNVDKLPVEIVYDVPKPNIPRRPRSSIYDDALSLKRRNDNFACQTGRTSSTEFYGFSCKQEPHYATIKPRNTRINANREFLRSVSDLNCNNTKYTDSYYGRIDESIRI